MLIFSRLVIADPDRKSESLGKSQGLGFGYRHMFALPLKTERHFPQWKGGSEFPGKGRSVIAIGCGIRADCRLFRPD